MTIQVNVGEAKTRLSELLASAESGEEVVIARAGAPIVRLVPVDRPGRRPMGFLRLNISDEDLFAPLPEDELRRWEGLDGDDD